MTTMSMTCSIHQGWKPQSPKFGIKSYTHVHNVTFVYFRIKSELRPHVYRLGYTQNRLTIHNPELITEKEEVFVPWRRVVELWFITWFARSNIPKDWFSYNRLDCTRTTFYDRSDPNCLMGHQYYSELDTASQPTWLPRQQSLSRPWSWKRSKKHECIQNRFTNDDKKSTLG